MTEAIATSIRPTYTVFLHLSTLPAWLRLTRGERDAVIVEHVAPLLKAHAPTTTLAWFDADAFSASPTDVAVITTTDLQDWYDLFEALRDTPLFSVPYYSAEQIVVTRGGGFRDYERRTGQR
jgi:hypothetical protein